VFDRTKTCVLTSTQIFETVVRAVGAARPEGLCSLQTDTPSYRSCDLRCRCATVPGVFDRTKACVLTSTQVFETVVRAVGAVRPEGPVFASDGHAFVSVVRTVLPSLSSSSSCLTGKGLRADEYAGLRGSDGRQAGGEPAKRR